MSLILGQRVVTAVAGTRGRIVDFDETGPRPLVRVQLEEDGRVHGYPAQILRPIEEEPEMSESQPQPSTELATRPVDPELERIGRLGMWLAAVEGGDPRDVKVGAAAAYRVWVAQQLDIGPNAASELSVINNNIAMSSELLRALAYREGYTVHAEDSTRESCTAVLRRNGKELGRVTFTIEDAKQAGLAGKTNWRMYPQRMLWARASGYVVRDYAPGVALGFVTREEMGDETDVATLPDDEPEIDWVEEEESAEFETIPPGPLDEEETQE